MVYHALEAVVPKEQFPATAEKIDLFARSFGTVLYFIHEDRSGPAGAVSALCA
jgi:predicted oxidoreductase (fatty acid repression mutant protein)